jgi:hypothetical protein
MSNRTPEHEQRRQLLARWERRGTLSPGERSELLRLLDMGSSGDRALAGLIRRDLGEDGAREEAASPEERVDAIMERIYAELEEGTELEEGRSRHALNPVRRVTPLSILQVPIRMRMETAGRC